MMNYVSNQKLKTFLRSPLLFIVLSIIFPTVFLLGTNSYLYTADQIIATLILMFFVSIVTALAAGISTSLFVKVTLLLANKNGFEADTVLVSSKLHSAILGGVGTLIILILLHSAFRELLPLHNDLLLALLYLLVSLLISILMYRFELKLINSILCVLIVSNCVLGALHGYEGKRLNMGTQNKHQKVVFKQKPNVYLVILESYVSLNIRKDIFGINNAPLTQVLNDINYDVYKCFSNYSFTLASVSSIFLMDHHYYKPSDGILDGRGYRKIIGGIVDNPVLDVFIKNGYAIDYNKFDSSFYQSSPILTSHNTLPLIQPIELFEGVFLFAFKILHKPLWTIDLFKTFVWLPNKITGKLPKQLDNPETAINDKPKFSLIYAGAAHTPYFFSGYPAEIRNLPGAAQMPFWELNHVNNYWVTAYKEKVAKSDAALIELVRDLAEKDPDAIVILVGDHGTYFNRNRWTGLKKNPNDNMMKNAIQPADMTRDLFEVFMAIKWPSGTIKPHEYFSHVNIFRQVFAVLAKDTSILQTQVSNNSYMFPDKYSHHKEESIYITVKDGILLDLWEHFTVPGAQ